MISNLRLKHLFSINLLLILAVSFSFSQEKETTFHPKKAQAKKEEKLFQNGGIDDTFSPKIQPNAEITAAAIQKNGKILIGGKFKLINEPSGEMSDRVVRLNTDGSIDKTFLFQEPVGWNSESPISVIKLQSDGKILVAKDWRIIRLNTDGTIDNTFSSATFISFGLIDIFGIQIYPDGKLLVSGYFEIVNGQSMYKVARLKGDGTLDTSFSSNNGGGLVNVNKSAIGTAGKIYLALSNQNWASIGLFPRLNSDGGFDSTFRWSKTSEEYKNAWEVSDLTDVVIEKDGNLLISGKITNNSGLWNETINGIYRMNQNGDIIDTFEHLQPLYGTKIYLQEDGKIIALSQNGTAQDGANLVRFFSNGKKDHSFRNEINFTGGYFPFGSGVLLQKDGKVLVFGQINEVNGLARQGIVRFNSNN
ncbi:MAG: delta-60 repeat domain-containing protein [Pyrinomonadaceae bacterium]|nr:delta-60 repeat domain-containing protein [Pyrinomonadaceae bacterium]